MVLSEQTGRWYGSLKTTAVCFILLSCIHALSAKEIYLSSNGDDAKNGLSSENAVATLTKALSLIPDNETGNIINVSGFIDISKETSNSAGISFNREIHCSIEGSENTASGFDGNQTTGIFTFQNVPADVTFKNLTFQNGKSNEGGAVKIINSGSFIFDHCIFKNNQAEGNGGAITIKSSALSGNAVVIRNSLIAYNESTGGAGGGIFIHNGTVNNTIQVSLINSTVYGNLSKTYGGAVFVSGNVAGSSFSLINCTLTENHTQGNGGHGAGLNFRDAAQGMIRYFYNSIIEDNTALNGGNLVYSDLASNQNPNEGTEDLIVRNTYIGALLASAGTYKDQPEYNNTIKYGNTQAAGLANPSADYIASQNSVPLEFESEALKKGDALYLQALNINTDQLGNLRAFQDKRCAAGAVEVPAELVITNPDPHAYQHFIIYGQSLSVGQESFYPISVENVAGNYMIGDQMWINLGNSNLNELKPLVASRTISYNKTCENPLIAAVNHIRKKQEQDFPAIENRFIATSCGTGAQPIENLSKGSERGLYEKDFLTAIKQGKKLTAKTGSTITAPAIFWMQGENDYNSTKLPKEEYKDALVLLKNDMQADIMETYRQNDKPVFFTYQTGGVWTNGNRELLIGMAQLEVSNQYDDIICVGPTYQLSFSNNHLCSNGSRWYGEYMAKVYYKTQVLGEKFKPLQPKALYRDAQNPKKVIVQYHVPEPPLVFDTFILEKYQNYGFSLYMDNGKQTITDVQIAGDCVEITCANNLTGNLEVIYGEKNTLNGHGNLRDSDAYQAQSNYVDADAKDTNGDYIYPRIDEYESLRPITREPMDAAGNIIYNQAYPLYNFSVAFYYAIPEGETRFEVPALKEIPTGVKERKATNSINILQLGKFLQIHTTDDGLVQVSILDLSGKTVKRWDKEKVLAQTNWTCDLSAFNRGIYIVKAQTPKAIEVKKIMNQY
jgi:hypothetical protein